MGKRVIGLGFFDGVHIGHGALLSRCRDIAKEKGLSSCAMTYSRHPSEVIGNGEIKLLSTPVEREYLIRELYGIEEVIIREFDREYASLSPEEFVKKILKDELSSEHVVAGFDFRFGEKGKGDAKMLLKLCNDEKIGCEIIDEVRLDGEEVSSSHIRKLISKGDVVNAARFLGHSHCIIGEVSRGDGIGRGISFPTINQLFSRNAEIPKHGVYISRVTTQGRTWKAVTNIGVRPTVSSSDVVRAETHILDFSGELYGEVVKTELLEFCREEKRFESLAELSEQIARDVEFARLVKV